MEYKKINELTTVVTGGTPSTRKNEYWDNGDIPWLQSGCCQNCDVDSTEKYITKEGYNNSSTHMMSADTVMIALTGATAGKVGYLKFEACGNQSITGILPCESLNQRYLFFYLLSQREKILADCVGGAQAHISQSYVKNMTIPILAIKEQEQIVGELTKVSNIVSLRQEEIQQLDNLVKARFVELFGDPVANPMHWPVKRLKELAIQINSGNTPKGGSENYVEKGITFFRSQNVWKDRLEMDDIAYIDEKTHESMKRSSLKHGDILMTKTGRINTENSSLGRAALYEGEDDMANVNGHVYFIRLKEGVNNKFVLRVLVSPEYRDLIRSVCVGGIDKRQLNKEHIEEFPIIYPPSEMIDNYIEFVEQVNKSKFDTMTFAPIYDIINLYLHTHFYQGRR